MDLTNSSLSVWIEEARKASYFSKHFVTLSKMINDSAVTMALGLATLHACGESLEKVTMSIQDLIYILMRCFANLQYNLYWVCGKKTCLVKYYAMTRSLTAEFK